MRVRDERRNAREKMMLEIHKLETVVRMRSRLCTTASHCNMHAVDGGGGDGLKSMNKIAEKMNSVVELDIVFIFLAIRFFGLRFCFCFFALMFIVVAAAATAAADDAKTLIISNVSHFHCGIARQSTRVVLHFMCTFYVVGFHFQRHQSYNGNFCASGEQRRHTHTHTHVSSQRGNVDFSAFRIYYTDHMCDGTHRPVPTRRRGCIYFIYMLEVGTCFYRFAARTRTHSCRFVCARANDNIKRQERNESHGKWKSFCPIKWNMDCCVKSVKLESDEQLLPATATIA